MLALVAPKYSLKSNSLKLGVWKIVELSISKKINLNCTAQHILGIRYPIFRQDFPLLWRIYKFLEEGGI